MKRSCLLLQLARTSSGPNCVDNFLNVLTLYGLIEWLMRITSSACVQPCVWSSRWFQVCLSLFSSGGIRSRFIRLQRGVLQLLVDWIVQMNSCEMKHLFFVFCFTLWDLQPAASSLSWSVRLWSLDLHPLAGSNSWIHPASWAVGKGSQVIMGEQKKMSQAVFKISSRQKQTIIFTLWMSSGW